jgi:hypothetical protein
VVTVDLRQDAIAVRALLIDAVKDYSEKHTVTSTAKQHSAISRIDLSFSLGDSESTPWVHVNLDAKAGGEPDGNPSRPDFARLDCESWLPAVQAVCNEERVAVVRLNGETEECGSDELGRQIGEFLVKVLLDARAAGTFASLPKSHRCELGVEDPTTGEFGWPNYDDRGKENLAEPDTTGDWPRD